MWCYALTLHWWRTHCQWRNNLWLYARSPVLLAKSIFRRQSEGWRPDWMNIEMPAAEAKDKMMYFEKSEVASTQERWITLSAGTRPQCWTVPSDNTVKYTYIYIYIYIYIYPVAVYLLCILAFYIQANAQERCSFFWTRWLYFIGSVNNVRFYTLRANSDNCCAGLTIFQWDSQGPGTVVGCLC